MSSACIDGHILRKYWNDVLTSEALRIFRVPSVPGEVPPGGGEWRQRFEEILGSDRFQDLRFEARCAEAYTKYYDAPFYVHVFYNMSVYVAQEVGRTRRAPVFPSGPVPMPASDVQRAWRSVLEDAPLDPPKSAPEAAVDTCPHARLEGVGSLHLRFGLQHLESAGYFSGTEAPVCFDCGAKIVCSCISESLRWHLGRTHCVLYEDHEAPPKRRGDACIGFRPKMCDLCRDAVSPPANEARFRDVVAMMYAVKAMQERDPELHKQVFPRGISNVGRLGDKEAAEAFRRIVGGADVRTLRVAAEIHVDPSQLTAQERWYEYLRQARNLFRARHGLPGISEGWVSEMRLYEIVRQLFPDDEVLHDQWPHWLEGLQLDVFVPSKRLAIEYMGLQHYQPVERFGGAEQFEKVQERDRRKAQLCDSNGITLIHVRYDDDLSITNVHRLIKNAHRNPIESARMFP